MQGRSTRDAKLIVLLILEGSMNYYILIMQNDYESLFGEMRQRLVLLLVRREEVSLNWGWCSVKQWTQTPVSTIVEGLNITMVISETALRFELIPRPSVSAFLSICLGHEIGWINKIWVLRSSKVLILDWLEKQKVWTDPILNFDMVSWRNLSVSLGWTLG